MLFLACAADIRSQLEAHLRRLGVPLRSELEGPGRDLDSVRKALASGLFINAARLTDELDVKLSGECLKGVGVQPGGVGGQQWVLFMTSASLTAEVASKLSGESTLEGEGAAAAGPMK